MVDDQALDAVVFDYGGVLTTPLRESTGQWLARDGIVPDSFAMAMREWLGRGVPAGTPVHRLETGELAGPDFEALFAERLRTHAGTPVPAAGLLSRLFAGMRTDPAMLVLVSDLRALGLRVGLLSNSWGNHYPDDLAETFDAIVISGEVGLRKPDPAIYRLVLDKLDVQPARAAFVDDAPVNIEAADALGMHGIRHRDAATTRAALHALIPALAKDGTA